VLSFQKKEIRADESYTRVFPTAVSQGNNDLYRRINPRAIENPSSNRCTSLLDALTGRGCCQCHSFASFVSGFVQENWRSMMAPAQKTVIRRPRRAACIDTNLPNNCCDCNRMCINSDLSATVEILPTSRFPLRDANYATPNSSLSVSPHRYHPINRICITRAWPIMKRADARYVLPTYNWAI